jgi:spoIIIJ-associated protein
MDQVETSGRTVEDALKSALHQLRASMDDVEFVVLDEGKRGFIFGAGGRDARVRVTRVKGSAPAPSEGEAPSSGRRRRGGRGRPERQDGAAPRQRSRRPSRAEYEQPVPELTADDFLRREAGAPQPAGAETPAPRRAESRPRRPRRDNGDTARARRRTPEVTVEPNIDHELVDMAATIVDDMLRMFDIDAGINLREPVTPGDGLGSSLAVIDISGDDLGVLIGRRGETLLNMQYLVNLIVSRRFPDQGGVTIDVEHYRHRREEQVVDLATRMADRVKENGTPITLEPMPAAERRLVHLALADDDEIETHSTGDGEQRKVVISLRD